ncbi:phage holin family protein [Xylanimonas oleitrophica]|uniref:Phage holin family protein n=1 Tax=Xylanimonas oleitrophica TaxID=2607479 RepID=A0A2W5Y5Q2_9MICO|nr:phage holin family protein [Xylanimonas oleitrophica]PZR53424.1 phage holin family protein [Xylanimonas oleitrophica]
MNFVVRVLVTALALWLTSLLLPGRVDVVDDGTNGGTVLAVLVVALVFNVVHSVIKPIVSMLSLPLYILTLGLFTLVVNAFMLWITTWITGQTWFAGQPSWGLEISGGFWWYVLAALIISVLQVVIGAFAPKRRD